MDVPPDEKPPNPVSPVMQPSIDDGQDTKLEAVKESSPTSVFVNSEPIREDQVQNAIKFLSHPKVRGSPVMYRRSFLERKGLTREEIDEAFRRVPDPTPVVSATPHVVANQDGQKKTSPIVQQQHPTQVLQPTLAGPVSKMGTLSRFHWSHALLAVGFLAVSGAGTAVLFKKTFIPRLKSWIRKIVFEEEEKEEESLLKKKNEKPSIAEEAAAAAKAAAAAAADVARASQEILMTKSEDKRCFEDLISIVKAQVHEMKSMSSAIQKLEGDFRIMSMCSISNMDLLSISGQSINVRIAEEEDIQRASGTNSRKPYYNGKADTGASLVRSLSPPASVEPAAAPHPKSYMEIMAMIQRGEKPSNIREINDAPPNPNQPVSNPRLAPKQKPWEISQAQNSSTNYDQFPDNQLNEDDTVPWWQRKNVRITETDEQKFGSSNVLPVQRSSWVPPQPPPVVMPEAAAAIRQQPKRPSNEQMTDDQLLARSQDDLQRITKISESGGGTIEVNGENSTEIQREENGSYLET
ncbi:hypothetical protein ACJIZ3_009931 [Penstemon smallii]|uniref:Peroxisomal membrane protein PEX14 n=1 Tax=Penstemon smallii TaxID=265156 RepID=A0ABD3TFF6_9LAMI